VCVCVMPNSTFYESFVSLFSSQELCSLLGNGSVNSFNCLLKSEGSISHTACGCVLKQTRV